MKKTILLLLILLTCSITYASIDSNYECKKKSCVEGSMVHWTVPVFNNINKTIKIEYIRLVDENSFSVAYYDAERNKTLEPGESYVYEFDQLIVAPPSGYTWYYRPCMRVWVEGAEESGFVCKDGTKSFTVLPRLKAGCFLDSDCATNEKCEEFTLKCISLGCKKDEAVENHRCVSKNLYERMPRGTRIGVLAAIAAVSVGIIAMAVKPKKKKSKKHKKKDKKQR